MHRFNIYFPLAFIVIVISALTLMTSCGSEEDPVSISEIITTEVSEVTLTTLKTGGTITAIANAEITAKGIVWGRNPNPVIGSATATEEGTGAGSFQSELTGLAFHKYYIRAYANADGKTYYGNEIVFDHSTVIPKMSSQGPLNATTNSVNIQTTITYTWPEPIIEKGICWGTVAAPTIERNNTIKVSEPALDFSVTISNLNQSQAYYARSYAVTSLGEFYGNTIQIFIVPTPVIGQIQDIDGNTYKTSTISGKTWMAENLKVTQYNDGTDLPALLVATDFKNAIYGAYTAYAGNNANASSYGYLYNGYVVNANKNICMTGWHVATSNDWFALATILGGINVAGGKMKEQSNLWTIPNASATNESGFSGLPGGSFCSVCLSNTGIFADLGTDGYWWSRDGGDFFYLTNDRADLRTKNTAVSNDGLSIRCVKD